MQELFSMQTLSRASCSYCGEPEQWSAERSDSTETGEEYACPSCDQSTAVWEGDGADELDAVDSMDWVHPEPLVDLA